MSTVPGYGVFVHYPNPRYRLNVARWRDAVRKVELDIRGLKDQMRRPGYQETFDWGLLLRLRAEATRLYALRAAGRGRVHPMRSGFRFVFHPYWKTADLRFFWASSYDLKPADVQALVVNGDADWLLGLLELAPAAAAG